MRKIWNYQAAKAVHLISLYPTHLLFEYNGNPNEWHQNLQIIENARCNHLGWCFVLVTFGDACFVSREAPIFSVRHINALPFKKGAVALGLLSLTHSFLRYFRSPTDWVTAHCVPNGIVATGGTAPRKSHCKYGFQFNFLESTQIIWHHIMIWDWHVYIRKCVPGTSTTSMGNRI